MIPLSYNVRNLFVRKATTAATAGGIGLVVWVFATAQMLSHGVAEAIGSSGDPKVAIVMSRGADAELSSNLDVVNVALVKARPEVAQRGGGVPDGTGEVVGVLALARPNDPNAITNVAIRGVEDNVYAFRPSVHILAGRAARPGSDEVVIGKAIRGRIAGVELGQSFEVRKNRRVNVVGVFEDGGSSYESEVWADVETVRTAFSRQGLVSSVRVRLRNPSDFDRFKRAIESDKQLGLQADRDTDYYEKQSQGVSIFLGVLGGLIAFFFSIGAMIGAMITMYAAVANRSREIGTLRALGFSKTNILVSFVFEAVLLSVIGGAMGAVASLGMAFVSFSVVNFASFSEIVFKFVPTPAILVSSLVAAGILGLFGGLFPAVRAARVPILQALRG